MIISGAASVPDPGGEHGRGALPDLDELRVALRPAELPLPRPRDVREAAHRVGDLVNAERFGEARALAEHFRALPAAPADRLALLRAALRAAFALGDGEQIERDAADLVTLLRRSGHPEQAAATVTVLLERGPLGGRSSAATRSALEAAWSPRGRRRGEPAQAPPELLAIARALELSMLPSPAARAGTVDPRRAVARLRAALTALPAVSERLLVDPEQELRLRLAQALEAVGDTAGATTAALDVLELAEQEEADAGGPVADLSRTATAAHAVLARTLGIEHPLQAVRHALDALDALHDVEDPPLRIGLITALLQALMAAGATAQASFTAGRLASLQRTLGRDALRTTPLLAVAAQRVQAQRYDAARVPLEQARGIAREHRDHRALLEAARLAASIHERTGDHGAALVELRRLAAAAGWLVDDLATPGPERGPYLRTELSANALALRRALDLGRTDAALAAARAIERRTRPDGGRPVLPPELLWDHRVDARAGAFIALGQAPARGAGGSGEADLERARQEVMQAIDEVPAGHEPRARYWAAYVDDHHAHLLAADDAQTARARRAAQRAREGWTHLGRDQDVTRIDALLERLGAD
ncbi:hypothetical protein [Brachybacterium sp. UNK5269]|uniref:hypothetical protein n=1 Tax=Brachybacterium sp. UNK5269 TaxID=3408576 RepID=UPI003BB1F122